MNDEEASIEEEEIETHEETEAQKRSYIDKLAELKARCAPTKITYTEDNDIEGEVYARLDFPNGPAKRPVFVRTLEKATNLLSVPFEDYCFVNGYEAICSYKHGTVEASIRVLGVSSSIFSRLTGNEPRYINKLEQPIRIAKNDPVDTSPEITIFNTSKEFIALNVSRSITRFAIKISGLSISQNSQALDSLLKYANSLFFQIEMLHNSSFMLERARQRVPPRLVKKREGFVPLQFPRTQYENAPISLYWYAKSARGMPLLQYLSFYQVIEFFYPRFSQIEARKRIAVILKDPTFREDRDDHIDKLISSISVNRSGGLGDERSQLRAVVNACVTADDMRAFLTESPDREAHFAGKSPGQRFLKIPIANKTADLRNDTADRIYDIRCKIVHTKNELKEGTPDMILPFSEEAAYLAHDVDLVNYIARSALVATSVSI